MYDLSALRDAALTLENDSEFYRDYTSQRGASGVVYRNLIRNHMRRLKLKRLSEKGPGTVDEAYAREQLRRYFHKRYDLPTPPDTSSCKDIDTVDFWDDPKENPMACGPITPDPVQPAQPENTMSNIITVEQRTFVNNVDISRMTDREIYSLISQAEAEIKSLELIENKPKRLQKDIEDRKAGIKALVEHLDARDAK